jgi:pimeloyl-ACP methyl ester carboxylesterase
VFVEECTVASIREARVAFEATEMKTKLARYHTDPAGAFWGWNDIWLSPEFRKWNIEDCLTGVRCPLLLMQCEDDPFGTLAQVDAIERQVSGPIDKCILPEGGHSPHLRQKQKTVHAVAEFITRTRELASATDPPDSRSV